MKETDTKVALHGDKQIYLEAETGRFYVKQPSGQMGMNDASLAGLKTKIDNDARSRARKEAANIKVVMREAGDEWRPHEGHKPTWKVVTFLGFNAHTGDLRVKNPSGTDERVVPGRTWFFLPDDKKRIEQIEALDADYAKKLKASKAAEAELNKALEALGIQLTERSQSSRRGETGTEKGAVLEQLLIEALTKRAAELKGGK